MNSGRTYIIQSLDYEDRVAVARGPVKVPGAARRAPRAPQPSGGREGGRPDSRRPPAAQVDYFTSVRDLGDIETAAPMLAYPPEEADAGAGAGDRPRLAAPPHYGPATVRKAFLG